MGSATGEGFGLVGREVELGALADALGRVRSGEPTVALVVGEAGMGKTSLIAAALADEDVVTLRATGDEGEVDVDFGVVDQLVRSAPLDRSTRDGLLPSADADPIAVGATMLRTLDELELPDPLAVVVDDAHLADVPSLAAVTFAMRRLRADPILLIVATRPEGVDRLPRGLRRLAERSGTVITLGGLDTEAIGALAASRYDRAIPVSAAERVHAHARGHPLHTRSLLEQLDYGDVVSRADLPAPRTFASLVASQLAGCSDEAQRITVALSVLGSPARLGDIAEVTRLDEPLAAADELVAAGLVHIVRRPDAVLVAFTHALIRASVYDDLPAVERARVHTAAARVSGSGEALRHRLAATAGFDDALAGELAEAAEAEIARGARRSAASHLLGAARVTIGGPQRERFVLLAAQQLLLAGQPLADLADEIEQFADGPRRSYVLGRLALTQGRLGEARRLLTRAWEQAQQAAGEEAALNGTIAELLAVASFGSMSPAEVMTWARRGLEGAEGTVSATMIAHAMAQAGELVAARDEMTTLLERSPVGPVATDARLGRGIIGVWLNDLGRAREDLDAVLDAVAETGLIGRVHATSYVAEIHLRSGRTAHAIDLAESTVVLIEDADAAWLQPLPRSIAATALARMGELERARAHAQAIDRVVEATGMTPARLSATQSWLAIATAEQDHAGVVAAGDRILRARFDDIPDGVFHWRAPYVESLAAIGRVDDAVVAACALEHAARRHGDISLLTEAARARAAVAAACGDHAGADLAFKSGLALDPAAARPYGRARLELAAGEAARRAGRRTAAAELLRAAADRFGAIGAQPWSLRAERELAACGLRPVKRSVTCAATELTSQERAIAALVANGRTNREVADQLIISVKTVEHHLSRAYAKLGVRSRTELAARGIA